MMEHRGDLNGTENRPWGRVNGYGKKRATFSGKGLGAFEEFNLEGQKKKKEKRDTIREEG